MTTAHVLRTDGYGALFELAAPDREGWVDLVAEFRLDPHLGRVTARSAPTSISTTDLERLVAYLEDHVLRLTQDPDTEAYTFVPLEQGFQLQAHAGHADPSGDGEFTITFMVDVGPSREEGTSVYVGGESVVTVRAVQDFASSVRAALARVGSGRS